MSLRRCVFSSAAISSNTLALAGIVVVQAVGEIGVDARDPPPRC